MSLHERKWVHDYRLLLSDITIGVLYILVLQLNTDAVTNGRKLCLVERGSGKGVGEERTKEDYDNGSKNLCIYERKRRRL